MTEHEELSAYARSASSVSGRRPRSSSPTRSAVEITGLSKTFPSKTKVTALASLDLAIPDGEMLVLLGPSGCGKTTTLRCLAGLEVPDTGTIQIGGRTVFDGAGGIMVAPHRREIGLVFQSFALWPHMTVRRNIEFPLRTRRRPSADRAALVEEVASMVDLSSALLDKRPHQLSGGQQQRVSLARALVAQPALILFDEPLSSLDAQLRVQVRGEIHKLHRRLGFTGVYVTHDLSEALALGTRVAVMSKGRVEQIGTPDDVFERPRTRAVARLFGYREMARGAVRFGSGPTLDGGGSMFIRPERLRVASADDPAAGTARLDGFRVVDVAYLGDEVELSLEGRGEPLRVPVPADVAASVHHGDIVDLVASVADIRYFETTSSRSSADNDVDVDATSATALAQPDSTAAAT